MISARNRGQIVELIEASRKVGGRLAQSCRECGITERTYFRWRALCKVHGSFQDLRKTAMRPEPANKLSTEERQKVIDTMSQPEFADLPPSEIVPALADKGRYLASESSFYRILHEHKARLNRGRAARPTRRTPETHKATAPCQLWSWDITYLMGPIKGIFFYLYLIVDIFSRQIVGWEVWEKESAEYASELVRRACLSENVVTNGFPLVLHSDNGSPMKGATMLETLYKLGITPSRSRPRVSNDNAYSESLFKTLKYKPNYQPDGFATLEEARLWCLSFVHWYNTEHHHSGLKFLTPEQRHTGEWYTVMERRKNLYEEAKASHPQRWGNRQTRNWTMPLTVYLNPTRVDPTCRSEVKQDAAV